jgi:hypothetical protein
VLLPELEEAMCSLFKGTLQKHEEEKQSKTEHTSKESSLLTILLHPMTTS